MAIKLSNLIGESHQNFASVFVALSPFGTPNLQWWVEGSDSRGRKRIEINAITTQKLDKLTTRVTKELIMSKVAFVILASGDNPESLGRVVNALMAAYEMMESGHVAELTITGENRLPLDLVLGYNKANRSPILKL